MSLTDYQWDPAVDLNLLDPIRREIPCLARIHGRNTRPCGYTVRDLERTAGTSMILRDMSRLTPDQVTECHLMSIIEYNFCKEANYHHPDAYELAMKELRLRLDGCKAHYQQWSELHVERLGTDQCAQIDALQEILKTISEGLSGIREATTITQNIKQLEEVLLDQSTLATTKNANKGHGIQNIVIGLRSIRQALSDQRTESAIYRHRNSRLRDRIKTLMRKFRRQIVRLSEARLAIQTTNLSLYDAAQFVNEQIAEHRAKQARSAVRYQQDDDSDL